MAHRETKRHLDAFRAWYDAGRSFRTISPKLAIPERTLRDWAEWFGWQDRADEWDREYAAQLQRDAAKRRAQMAELHRNAGRVLVAKGLGFFSAHEIDAARDATAAIKTGVEIERTAEGLPAWVMGVIGATDEELERRRQELLAAVEAEGAGGGRGGDGAEGDAPDVAEEGEG